MRALKLKRAGWMGLSLLLLAGFAKADPSLIDSPGSTAAAAAGTNDAPGVDFSKLEVVDSVLGNKISLLRIGSQRGTNNLLTVFAGLKNTTGKKLLIEVETIYKDKDGNVLNTGSWISLTLKAREQRDYRSASISEAATDFLIRVRRPPTVTASTHE